MREGDRSRRAWGAAWLLARRNVGHRPLRALLLCAGFGVGVGVMTVLLSVGEAMVTQASREQLVGGGEVTVLPEGVDIEVLTTGGLGGLFFSVPNARFVHRQVLGSPRLAGLVQTVAPQLEGKLLYLTTEDGVEHAVRATGELPSASRALGAVPAIAQGAWEDDAGDERWAAPTLAELRHDIDRFHLPPAGMANRASWGEWHYFNVLAPDASRWAFISFIVGGDPASPHWGGQVLVTVHERGREPRRYTATVTGGDVRFSTRDADLAIGRRDANSGGGSVQVLPNGDYAVRATARAADGTSGGEALEVDLTVTPAPRVDFPGATLVSGDFASGYAVAALRASASGTICRRGAGRGGATRCDAYSGAQAYHDHNWGGWAGVTWEWGATRAGPYTLLYGRVHPDAGGTATAPLFVYVADSAGFLALFRPREVRYVDGRTVRTKDGVLRVPSRAEIVDVRGADTLRLDLTIDDATATDMRSPAPARGDAQALELRGALVRPWFVQMAGEARLTGRIGGVMLHGTGRGFFETYR